MSVRSISVLLLALVFGATAAVATNRIRGSSSSGDVATVPVVVAAVEIPRGTKIGPSMLALRDWPKDMVPEMAISSIEEAADNVALMHIPLGDLVLSAKLAGKNAGRGLAPLIPDGMRAYTIQTSKLASNVAGFVLPQNRVDVLLTLKSTDLHDQTGGGISTTLLQAVEILAVDQQLDAPAENRTTDMRSVTLLVTPQQAGLLDLGQNLGQLTLSLRNMQDVNQSLTQPATLKDLRYLQDLAKGTVPSVDPEKSANEEKEQKPEEVMLRIRTLRGSTSGEVLVKTEKNPKITEKGWWDSLKQ